MSAEIIPFDRTPRSACEICPCADECEKMPSGEGMSEPEYQAAMDAWQARCDAVAASRGGERMCDAPDGWNL